MKSVTSPDGRSTRWDTHRATRRVELLRAVRAAVTEYGSELSMDQISTRTRTSKTVLYRYFGDRAGLQRACGTWAMDVIERHLTQAAQADTAHPADPLTLMVHSFVELAAGSPGLYRFCAAAVDDGTNQGFFTRVTQSLIHGLGLSTPDDHIWARGAVGFVRMSTEHWLATHTGTPITDAQIAAVSTQIAGWLRASLQPATVPPTPEETTDER
jgi:AcrR family transcriptional regulator